jgi:branched-chain amino acid transport system permease protein
LGPAGQAGITGESLRDVKSGKPSEVLLLCAGLIVLCLLPFFVSTRLTFFFSEAIIWILFALSYNLMLGHTGMLSLGHTAFFGLGAYAYGILTKKATLASGIAFAAVLVVGLISSLIIGYFCVRHRRMYFAFLTFAFSQMVYMIIYSMYDLTGGDDGLIGVPVPDIFASTTGSYYFILSVAAICLFLLLRINNSPFGAILHAVRDNSERVEFSGLKIRNFRLASFVIAGLFGAVAGALYTVLMKSAFLDYFGIEFMSLILFSCLLGGMHTFYGPVVGAVIVVALDKLLSEYTLYWATVTGVCVILIVILFPEGILGFLKERVKSLRNKSIDSL